MSITDELREWASVEVPYKYGHQLLAIADRIDAEHASACAEAYGDGVMSVPIVPDESAWVRLPKDADGEYIRVGERVQLIGNDPSTVSHMSLSDDGWRVYVKYDGEIGTGSGEPKRIRHYHAPTVEDVLREFTDRVCNSGHQWGLDAADTIAEYAKRLTLAEGEDA